MALAPRRSTICPTISLARVEAGIIREIDRFLSCTELEQLIMRAAVVAQCEAGAAPNVHPCPCPQAPAEVVTLWAAAGEAVERMIINRIDRTIFDQDVLFALACTDCVIEDDLFGIASSHYTFHDIDLPREVLRLRAIRSFIRCSHLRWVLVSQDIDAEDRFTRYSGRRCGRLVSIG